MKRHIDILLEHRGRIVVAMEGCRLVLLALAVISGCGRLAFDDYEQLRSDASDPDAFVSAPGVVTIAGGPTSGTQDGVGDAAQFVNPVNVVVGPDGNIYATDHGSGSVRVITPAGSVSTLVGEDMLVDFAFSAIFASDGMLLVGTDAGRILSIDATTGSFVVRAQGIGNARGLVELPGGRIAFANWNTDRIEILETNQTVTVLAGDGTAGLQDGPASAAQFSQPTDLVQRSDGAIFVGDLNNHRVRLVQPDGTTTTYAGSSLGILDGSALTARFNGPGALALAADGTLYVGDRFNGLIRRITTDGVVTTVAGNGILGFADSADPLRASFHSIEGLDLSGDERYLYIADGTGGDAQKPFRRIRRLTLY